MTHRMWVTLSLSHHISSHDRQHVSDTDINSCHAVSSHLIPLWPTGCEWHWHLFISAMQSHHILSYEQQLVSDTDTYVCHAVSSHFIPWLTAGVWQCHLFLPYSLISSHFISFHPMTNRMWVTLTFISVIQSHHFSSHDQQLVSGTDLFVPCSLIKPHPMTNSWWVAMTSICTMHCHHVSFHDQQRVSNTDIYSCHAVSSHLIPWPTACEWHWHLCLSCSLITSHPMANSMWVTLTLIPM